MDEIHRKRLEWMAKAKVGETFPVELGFTPNDWAKDMNETAQAALDEIERLNRRLLQEIASKAHDEIERLRACTIWHQWEPIETAPVPAFDMSINGKICFTCLVQGDNDTVSVAHALWKGKSRPRLEWIGTIQGAAPKYWMPLPSPRTDP
jgi:hypothetical protein